MIEKLSLKIKLISGAVLAVLIPFSVAGVIIYLQLSEFADRNDIGKVGNIFKKYFTDTGCCSVT